MEKKMIAVRALAIIGTALVWIPILTTLVTGIVGSIYAKTFRMDYLMPAELFPLVGVGSLLLLIAALLARSRRKWIIWSLVAMILTLVGGQVLASVSGLASGRTEPEGIWWGIVLASIGLYTLTIISMGIGGILLIKSVHLKELVEPERPS